LLIPGFFGYFSLQTLHSFLVGSKSIFCYRSQGIL